jgi:hypothetical protein
MIIGKIKKRQRNNKVNKRNTEIVKYKTEKREDE